MASHRGTMFPASQIAVTLRPIVPVLFTPRVCLTCHTDLSRAAGIHVVESDWTTAFVMCDRHSRNGGFKVSRDALNELISRLPR